MPKFNQVKACVTACLNADEPTMVHGEGGIGKTQMHSIIGRDFNKPVYLFSVELHQSVDLHGVPVPDMTTGTTKWMKPGMLPFEGTDLEPGLIFIDEINRAEKDMQSAIHPLILERKVQEHVLKPGCMIAAAGNRKLDKAGVNTMQRTLAIRLTHFHLEPDLESWISGHALKQTGNGWPILIAFLRLKERAKEKMERLFCNSENLPADCLAYPNPRSWSSVAKYIDFADETRFLSIAGKVGETAASELEAFLRIRTEIPGMLDILHDPMNAMVPNSTAACFAVAGMISHNADRKSFKSILDYAARLGSEFAAMVARDVTNRDASLCEHSAFVQWAINNQEMTL